MVTILAPRTPAEHAHIADVIERARLADAHAALEAGIALDGLGRIEEVA